MATYWHVCITLIRNTVHNMLTMQLGWLECWERVANIRVGDLGTNPGHQNGGRGLRVESGHYCKGSCHCQQPP